MSVFVITVFSLSVIFTIACALVSDSRFLRVERFLFSLIFASVLFSFFATFFREGEFPEAIPNIGGEGGENTFDTVMAEAVRTGLQEALKSEFSLSEEDFELTVSEVDGSTHLPSAVTVILKNKGVFSDTRRMEEYLREKGGFTDVRISVHLRT